MIYLDNATTSWPKPEAVYTAMDEFQRSLPGSPGRSGHSLATEAARIIEESRSLLAHLINACEERRVIFTLNCTDALNMALKGTLKPGDHVIVDSLAHNSVMRPLNVLSRTGVNVTRLRPAHAFSALSIADIEQAITCETKMLVITHASNVTGVLQPVLEYGALARRHGLIFLVDAAQTAGKYPIDVGESNIDLLALAGHKGLMGPTGTGALYISQRVDLNTWREGGTGSHSELEKQPGDFPDRYESGTLNGAGICGLGAGLKFILGEGLWSIQSHEQDLTFRLVSGLRNIKGIKLYVDSNNGGQIPVVSFNIEGYDPAEIGFILDNTFNIKVRTGLHCAPGVHRLIGAYPQGTVRFSPGYFNTLGEMDEAVAAVARIARARGHQRKGMKRSPVSNIPVN